MFKDDAIQTEYNLMKGSSARRSFKPESYWQIVSIPPRVGNHFEESSIAREAGQINVRFDPPENPFAPKLIWSAVVGFHQSLAESLPDDRELRQFGTAATPRVVEQSSESGPQQMQSLLAEAAHDIRSPINSASQILSAVLERIDATGHLGEPELHLIENAAFRLRQADGWAESILLARSLENGAPTVIRNRFYPLQLLELVRPLMNSIAESHRVTLEWVGWDRSLPRLYLDPNHLSRILLNLVTNAIEASQLEGTVTIRADWKQGAAPKFAISIEDHGLGIDRRRRAMINAQGSDTLDPRLPGIGLRVAKALVQAQGGSISVRPEPRIGTRVVVEMPVDDNATLIRNWLLSNAPAPAGGTPTTRHLRVTMHALRVRGLSSRFVDTYLQRATGPSDFVIRVAEHRWLWIALTDSEARSAAFSQSLDYLRQRTLSSEATCQSGLVYATQAFPASELLTPYSPNSRIAILTEKLVAKISELTAKRMVYVDDLQQRKDSVRGTSIEMRKSRVGGSANLRVDRPAVANSMKRSHLAKFAKPEPQKLGLGAPDAKLTQALIEIASHWHATHVKMEGRQESVVPKPKQAFSGNRDSIPSASSSELSAK